MKKSKYLLIFVLIILLNMTQYTIFGSSGYYTSSSYLDGKIFYIVNGYGNMNLDFDLSSRKAQIYEPYGNNFQKWKFVYDDSKKAYRIISLYDSNACLELDVSTCSSYYNVKISKSLTSSSYQFWTINTGYAGRSTFKISPKSYPTKALTTSLVLYQDDRANVVVNEYKYETNEKNEWYLIPANHKNVEYFISTYSYENGKKVDESDRKPTYERTKTYMENMRYTTYVNYDMSGTDVLNRLKNENTQIGILHGHGASGGGVITKSGSGIFKNDIDSLPMHSLSNLRLLIYFGCESNGSDSGGISYESHRKGASCVIAFTNTIYRKEVQTWLLELLKESETHNSNIAKSMNEADYWTRVHHFFSNSLKERCQYGDTRQKLSY